MTVAAIDRPINDREKGLGLGNEQDLTQGTLYDIDELVIVVGLDNPDMPPLR